MRPGVREANEHTALDALPAGVFVVDPEYRYVYVNTEAEAILGEPASGLIGRYYWDTFIGCRGTIMERQYRRAFSTGGRVEFRYFHNVRRSWFEVTAKTDASGRLVISMHDSTDLCRLEHALDSVEQELCESFRKAAIGVAITDQHGWFLQMNDAFCRITGYNPDELRSRDFSTLLHEDDRDRHFEARNELLAEDRGAVYECRFVRKGGAWVLVRNNVSVMLRPERQKTRFIILCEDITEARAAERKVRDSERRFRGLIERSMDLITILSPEGTVLYESPALQFLLGYRPTELIGANGFELMHPEDRPRMERSFRRLLRSGGGASGLFRLQHKDGSWRYIEGSVANMLDDPAVGGMVVNSRDVTDRVETQQKLRDALQAAREATEMKSRFLANMSHEIRTPMNGVVGLADLLLDTPLTVEQREYVQGVQYSAELLLRIIGDILDFSKIEAGKLDIDHVTYDLRSTLAGVAEIFTAQCRAKGLDFQLEVAPGIPQYVVGDGLRLRQILSNLLGNAVKFTSAGSVRMSAACANGRMKIAIRDTGVGIAPEHQPKLFASFTQADSSTTRQFGGTGLGLAISKELLHMMHGEIGFTSQLGQGSEFWLELPVELPPVPEISVGTAAAQLAPVRHARILVAEDNVVNQQIARAILEKAGFAVVTVGDGLSVLDALQRGSYDLVVMDVQMPRMDGYEATAAIRALDSAVRDIPVLAMTANAMNGDRERCLQSGMDDYLSKPVLASDMLTKITSLLNGTRMRAVAL